MKKLFLLATIAIFSLASCSEENFDKSNENENNKIGFKTMVGKNNFKVEELTQSDFIDFHVSAYRTNGNVNSIIGQTLIPYISNLHVYWNGNTWNYNGSYYWPGSDYLHFFAHNTESLLPTTSITGYPTLTYNQNPITPLDVIFAIDTNRLYTSGNPAIALQFYHALCQINFSLKGAELGPEYQIKKIELNARSTGTFTLKPKAIVGITSNWSAQGSPNDYVYYDAGSNAPTIISTTLVDFQTATNPIMIIPQNGEFVTIKVTYDFVNQGVVIVSNAIATANLTGEEMNVGKKVRYNLTIPTPTSIQGNKITFTGTVQNWDAEQTGGITTTTN